MSWAFPAGSYWMLAVCSAQGWIWGYPSRIRDQPCGTREQPQFPPGSHPEVSLGTSPCHSCGKGLLACAGALAVEEQPQQCSSPGYISQGCCSQPGCSTQIFAQSRSTWQPAGKYCWSSDSINAFPGIGTHLPPARRSPGLGEQPVPHQLRAGLPVPPRATCRPSMGAGCPWGSGRIHPPSSAPEQSPGYHPWNGF